MTGARSCRKLEAACRDQIPFLWLGRCQHPDHNTLWRFYQAHRATMRGLLKHTVRTVVEVGLVDLAVQALDGTKVAANAAGLERLLARTEAAIENLEAQNGGMTLRRPGSRWNSSKPKLCGSATSTPGNA